MRFLKVIAIYIIICYFIGSIPSGLIVGKIFHNKDIRNYGSGNLGSTNAARVLGITLGIIVGLMDLMKGGSAILLAENVFNTPIFARFKGGKAVATSGGVILFTSLPIFCIGLITFIVVVITTRVVSIASTAVAFMIFLSALIAYFVGEPLMSTLAVNLHFLITMSVLFSFVILRHIPNYKRLLLGKENMVGNNKHGIK